LRGAARVADVFDAEIFDAALVAAAVRPSDCRAGGRSPMKLTRLRLIGFKSFVEPTEFLI
jgi:hypothetical protein